MSYDGLAPAVGDPARLAALARTGLWDSGVETPFDRQARLAALALDAPYAVVSLIAEHRQFLKSAYGMDEPLEREAPLSRSFCKHVVGAAGPFVVEDAKLHPLVVDNDATVDDSVRSYCGAPIRDPEGHVLGALAVFDVVPRTWNERDVAILVDLAEAVTSELALRAVSLQSRRAAAMVEVSDDVILSVSAEGRVVSANPATERHYGWKPADLVGRAVADLVPPERMHEVEQIRERQSRGEPISDLRTQRLRKDGTLCDVSLSIAAICDDLGQVVGHASIARDISSSMRTEEALRRAEERLERAFEAAPVGMGLADLDGYWTKVNDAMCEMIGYSREELLTMSATELSHPDDLAAGQERVKPLLDGDASATRLQKRYLHKSGRTVWVDVGVSMVHDAGGRPSHYVALWEDITARREQEEQLVHLATHDLVTGLANRRYFTERLQEHLDHGARYGHGGTVLLVDLDHFKTVNDTFGHQAGDTVLIATAMALRSCLRSTDVVARFGGDEFAVLLPEEDEEAANAVADKLVTAVRHRVRDRITVTASIGLAAITAGRCTVDELLADADAAMYRAKRGGQDRWFRQSADEIRLPNT